MIQTVDNSLKKNIGDLQNQELRNHANTGFQVTLDDFLTKSQCQLLNFINDEEKISLKNSKDDLVFRCFGESHNFFIDTGNYIGKLCWPVGKKYLDLEIGSRFSGVFLQRMLNFANDVYLDDFEDKTSTENQKNTAQFILYYLFIQALEKAYLLGLPKSYQSVVHHEARVKGKIDINQFIRKDIPFKGKVSSKSREQLDVPEVVDVLCKAVTIVTEQNVSFRSRVNHIVPHLKQARSSYYVSSQTIRKAKSSKALQNPIFSPYKRVLNLAEMVIRQHELENIDNAKEQGFGFLINVAELFELYITKLLQKEFPDWQVGSESVRLYPEQFYSRRIIPDIVMRKNNKVVVFDTKYKRMKLRGTKENHWDVDRNDFFQINSYMSYYQNISSNNKLIVGGLLYPIESKFDKDLCYSQAWFGNENVIFIVDGIDLSGLKSCTETSLVKCIIKSEEEFIGRIRILLELY